MFVVRISVGEEKGMVWAGRRWGVEWGGGGVQGADDACGLGGLCLWIDWVGLGWGNEAD